MGETSRARHRRSDAQIIGEASSENFRRLILKTEMVYGDYTTPCGMRHWALVGTLYTGLPGGYSLPMDGPLESGKLSGFQALGSAWDPCRSDITDLLQSASFERVEPIYYGSNHTFLVSLTAGRDGTSLAVYKPARGEYPLYDFSNGSLYRREVASWLLSDMLRWNLVPPAVVAQGTYGPGSLQVFIEAHAGGEIEIAELRRLSLLDILLNNADRKAEHCLVGDNGKLWGIDHGLTFHAQPKLRTVIWHFAGTRIPADDLADLKRVRILLNRPEGTASNLKRLIAPREWTALTARFDRLVADGCFPNPRYKPVPYRW